MSEATLPVSLILATFSKEYVDALSAFRYSGEVGGKDSLDAVTEWVTYFCQATLEVCRQAESLKEQVAELRQLWADMVDKYRQGQGLSRKLRTDSATARVLSELPGMPVLVPETIVSAHSVSRSAALAALDELTGAGVLSVKKWARLRQFILPIVFLSSSPGPNGNSPAHGLTPSSAHPIEAPLLPRSRSLCAGSLYEQCGQRSG